MPGPQVKNWPRYEALRRQGKSKELAAKIANSQSKHKPRPLSPKAKR